VSGGRLEADLWITEQLTPYDVYHHGVRTMLAHKRTQFQEMSIVDCGSSGKALVLDGKWQSSTVDEFLYHEPLVHPAMISHGGPKRVLVLGGGEGATVREVLKWKSVERVVMVDIDGEVVDACREHLPEMHDNAFDDPRTEVVIGDALHHLDQSENEWDVIISDLSDPIEHGPSFALFTREYFERCRRALSADGWFVVQAGPVSPQAMGLHVRLVNTVGAVFESAVSYSSFVPSYAQPWGFALACDARINADPDPAATDALLHQKTTGAFRMMDGITLRGLLNTPKHIRDAIAAETEVYTLEKPPKFIGSGAVGGI